jgi:hypothetical protein
VEQLIVLVQLHLRYVDNSQTGVVRRMKANNRPSAA